jgi:protein-S-isoprenylcysteine O-methyltransferase Ste14
MLLVPFLIFWSILVAIAALHMDLPRIMTRFLIHISWLKYTGILFCYAGLVIFLLALLSFGNSWRIGIDEETSNKLITGGIFKYSRNPIFVFMDIYFLGIALIYPTIVFVPLAILTIASVHLQIVREEKFLLHKFGEKYVDYKKRTRRYV